MNLMHQQCPDMTEIDLEWPIKPLSRLNALNLIQLDDFLVLSKDLFCQSRNIMSDYDLAIQFNTVYVLVYDVFNRTAQNSVQHQDSPNEARPKIMFRYYKINWVDYQIGWTASNNYKYIQSQCKQLL